VIVVSDTSPITNLAAVGRLDLLRQIYGQVIIPHVKQDLYQRVLQAAGE
jgi:predicted nucleic acid-binding protein